MADTPDAKLAVLIDADNAHPSGCEALLAEVAKFGIASVKRIYGDWTTTQLRAWKEAANTYAVQPMQQFAYTTGKNATDSAMIIDAMDLLYTERFDGFVLVSSDSDFTKLASRLREHGRRVYGFGERKTPAAFVSACDRFVYMDVLREVEQAPDEPLPAKRTTAKELRGEARLVNLLRRGIAAASDDEGWAHLGSVGTHIAKEAPDFDPRTWGHGKLVDLVTAIGLFEVERMPAANGRGGWVRVRAKKRQR